MSHVVLVGDGILANGAHTGDQPDTATVLRARLSGWKVTLLAAVGTTMAMVPEQLERVPPDANLLVLSVGGSDALEHVTLLQQPARSSGETLDALLTMARDFGEKYQRAAEQAAVRVRRTLLCTIYEPPLVGNNTADRARVLLTLMNDQILRTACRLALDVLDLRAALNAPGDFTMQIQPSAAGAAKIAGLIASGASQREGRGVTVVIL